MKKIRQEFADTMLEVGKNDPNLVVLIGDISHFILQPYAKACPGRFYNVGICEPTIVNMAAGLAKVGFYPVIHTFSPFIVERSFEQIKDDFGYQELGVNILTVGSAFDATKLGVTHHCYGDFALLKTIPQMQIFYPGSPKELNLLFKQTYDNGKPTFMRIAEGMHEIEFSAKQIKVGKGIKMTDGKDLTIIALGPHLKTALDCVPDLYKQKIHPEIIYLPTVKPLDVDLVRQSLSKTKKCLVIEEHSMYGGISDDILRVTWDMYPIRFASINLGDKYIHAYGTYKELCDMLGFSVKGIIKKVKELFV